MEILIDIFFMNHGGVKNNGFCSKFDIFLSLHWNDGFTSACVCSIEVSFCFCCSVSLDLSICFSTRRDIFSDFPPITVSIFAHS